MQLRSGTSIASGSIATTKASTQASGTQAKGKLSIIIKDYSSRSSKMSTQTTSEASVFMEGFGNMNLNVGFPMVDAALFVQSLSMKIGSELNSIVIISIE